eukprot:6212713-Pleurochrysis_carterae.AAC.2
MERERTKGGVGRERGNVCSEVGPQTASGRRAWTRVTSAGRQRRRRAPGRVAVPCFGRVTRGPPRPATGV